MKRFAAAIALVAIGAPARAEDAAESPKGDDGLLHQLASDVRAQLDAAGRAHAPKPPVPIAVKWKPLRIDTLDLGAPVAALVAGDLDHDGKSELYAVTAREVIALVLAGGRAKELGRVTFDGEPAVPASRDLVGAAVIDGDAVLASVSTYAHGTRASWQGKTLVGARGEAGFALCAGEHEALAAGRNYFGDAKTGFYGVRCRRDLIDPAGRPLHVRAVLELTGKLDVAVESCAAEPCVTSHFEYPNVGFAFEIADVDHDGKPELIYSAANAPGDTDVVKVVTIGGDEKRPLFKRKFDGEGIAGIAVIAVDGGEEILVVSRQFGSSRLNLWRLD
ncbi:MAG: repeat protein [Myxococcales bacterium]|nr:repeat protein [Myxococcales bacterium]